MISLAPINKKVRESLAAREDAIARRSSYDSHESISDKLNHQVLKTLWVKMYSAVEWNGVSGARIYGGEVFKNEGEGYPLPFGFAELYNDALKIACYRLLN